MIEEETKREAQERRQQPPRDSVHVYASTALQGSPEVQLKRRRRRSRRPRGQTGTVRSPDQTSRSLLGTSAIEACSPEGKIVMSAILTVTSGEPIQPITDLREVALTVHGGESAHLAGGEWSGGHRTRPSHRERRLRRGARHVREQVLPAPKVEVRAGGSEHHVPQAAVAAATTRQSLAAVTDMPAGQRTGAAGTQRRTVLCRGARARRQAWVRHRVRKHLVRPEEGTKESRRCTPLKPTCTRLTRTRHQ